tara:strand:- start:33200 stop:33970 length:771 start_codon:yes stop_codon:yes gene_type:complete
MESFEDETIEITDAQKAQFVQEGFFVIESAIPKKHLTMLRNECDRYVRETDQEMAKKEISARGITHKGSRYFISNRHRENNKLCSYIFSSLMASICRKTLGKTAYLFHEQFVVKGPEIGMKFGWHQDSGYIGFDHRPYMSCWAALDNVNEENGTVYILPFSAAGTRSREEHQIIDDSNDKIGYFGEEKGIPVICPAGSILVFSSVSFHRSSPNRSAGWRRVFLSQYSAEPILTEDGKEYWSNAEKFLVDGKNITNY